MRVRVRVGVEDKGEGEVMAMLMCMCMYMCLWSERLFGGFYWFKKQILLLRIYFKYFVVWASSFV